MNKAELIEAIANDTGVTKKLAGEMVDAFIYEVTKALKKGHEVRLVGFGTFKVVKRKARTGVNPQTGQKMRIPARKVPKFVPGKELKKAV